MFGIFRKPVTGTRTTGGWVNGAWVPPTTAQITISASVQPADKDQVELLPGGRRLTGAYAVFTNDELKISVEATAGQTGQIGDVLNLFGGKYEVLAREPWQNNIINHNVYIVSRIVESA